MDEALQRAQELVAEWDEEMRRELPEDSDIFDAHLHLGHDIDGMVGDYDDLERVMESYGISRAFMFCMDEPDRHPGFRAPNDRTLEFAERSEGRLIPFVRLDLGEEPIEEASAASTAAPAGSSSTRGLSGSSSTTNGSRRCSQSPPSAASRS